MDLNQFLTKEQRQHGLTLCDNEDLVFLIKNGQTVARFSSGGVTIAEIRKEADKWLPDNDAVKELIKSGGISFK